MPDYYTHFTGSKVIPCSREEAQPVIDCLRQGTVRHDFTWLEENGVIQVKHCEIQVGLEFAQAQLHIFGGEQAAVDRVPEKFWPAVGSLLQQKRIPYLECGMAFSASKLNPGSHGGSAFRVYPDGLIVWAECRWPRRSSPNRSAKRKN